MNDENKEMIYLHVAPHPTNEIWEMINSGNIEKITYAIVSITLHGNDYNAALEVCQKLYTHSNPDIRYCVLVWMPRIYDNYGKIDLDMAIKIIKHGFDDQIEEIKYAAEEALVDLCHRYREKRFWILGQISDIKLSKQYEYLYITQEVIEKIHETIRKKNQQLELCCENMFKAISKYKNIEYEPMERSYTISINEKSCSEIMYCPWCGVTLGKSLIKEWFYILESEYGIEYPDCVNFTNVPEEFYSDEWWKKRGYKSFEGKIYTF